MSRYRFKNIFLVITGLAVLMIVIHLQNPQLYEKLLDMSYHFEDNQFHTANNSYKCDGKWIEWYKKFHADSLRSTNQNRRFLVFYCPGHSGGCGGYGNRMVGLISTFYLSVLLERVFMIHWGGPEKFEAFLLPNQIDWTYDASKLQGLSTRSHYWGVSKPGGFDRYIMRNEANFLKWVKQLDPGSLFDRRVVKLDTIWYFAEHLWENRQLKKRANELGMPRVVMTYPYAMIGCAMKFLFKKSKYLMKEFSKEKSRLGPREHPLIGIHVRTSDHHWGSTNRYSYRTRNPRRVFLCAQRVEKALKNKYIHLRKRSLTWFLAADDKNLKQRAQTEYPSNVMTFNIRPRHMEINGEDFHNILRDLLMDQLMLLECDYFLPTWDSTFSYVALGTKQFSVKNFVFGENCALDEKTVSLAP